jgi:hypothetical protein
MVYTIIRSIRLIRGFGIKGQGSYKGIRGVGKGLSLFRGVLMQIFR